MVVMNGIIYDVGIGLFSKKKMNFNVYFAILQILITILGPTMTFYFT